MEVTTVGIGAIFLKQDIFHQPSIGFTIWSFSGAQERLPLWPCGAKRGKAIRKISQSQKY